MCVYYIYYDTNIRSVQRNSKVFTRKKRLYAMVYIFLDLHVLFAINQLHKGFVNTKTYLINYKHTCIPSVE